MDKKKTFRSYRLLHTASWLNDQSCDEENAQLLERLLIVVKQHEVGAILLAGDVFDRANLQQFALSKY